MDANKSTLKTIDISSILDLFVNDLNKIHMEILASSENHWHSNFAEAVTK
jgi:hypothetical protein